MGGVGSNTLSSSMTQIRDYDYFSLKLLPICKVRESQESKTEPKAAQGEAIYYFFNTLFTHYSHSWPPSQHSFDSLQAPWRPTCSMEDHSPHALSVSSSIRIWYRFRFPFDLSFSL